MINLNKCLLIFFVSYPLKNIIFVRKYCIFLNTFLFPLISSLLLLQKVLKSYIVLNEVNNCDQRKLSAYIRKDLKTIRADKETTEAIVA